MHSPTSWCVSVQSRLLGPLYEWSTLGGNNWAGAQAPNPIKAQPSHSLTHAMHAQGLNNDAEAAKVSNGSLKMLL
jgi:hypothetical protein